MHVFLSTPFFCSQWGIFTSFENIHAVPHTAPCFLPLTSLEQHQQPVLLVGIIYFFFFPQMCLDVLFLLFLPGIRMYNRPRRLCTKPCKLASHAVSFASCSFSSDKVWCGAANTNGPVHSYNKLNEANIFDFLEVFKGSWLHTFLWDIIRLLNLVVVLLLPWLHLLGIVCRAELDLQVLLTHVIPGGLQHPVWKSLSLLIKFFVFFELCFFSVTLLRLRLSTWWKCEFTWAGSVSGILMFFIDCMCRILSSALWHGSRANRETHPSRLSESSVPPWLDF